MSSLRFQLPNRLNLLFLIFAILWTCHEAVTDTLKPGDTLNSSSFLVSAKGKFTLGFHVINPNSKSSYLAIWQNYLNTWQKTGKSHAWIGNRYSPIVDPLGVLTLDVNKTLKIMHKGGDPVVLYPASGPTSINSISSVVATLLDSGNFVMQELNPDGSMKRVLWQSFDYPTHTLLPGMKVGVNHRNGHIWSISSWSSVYWPAPGPFTLVWDPNGRELKIKRRGVVYWTSGIFRDGQFEFMKPYDDMGMVRFEFSIVSNENEDYFTYTTASVNQSHKPEWVLNIFGQLLELEGNVIAPADQCYGFNTDKGCQSRDYPSCRHIGDTFVENNGYFISLTSNQATEDDLNTSLTLSDCKEACWQDCDCLGFLSLFDNQTGCKFWVGNWVFSSHDLFGYSNPRIFILSELSRNDTNSADTANEVSDTNRWIWIGTSIASALLVMVICILCFLLRRKFLPSGKRQQKIEKELLDLVQSDQSFNVKGLPNDEKVGHSDLGVHTYASVLAATSNFSEENKLGEGGFGPVYRGKSVTGRDIAVKRLSRCSGQGALEFKNELILISELQHTNLVQLLGFCTHGEERMLIYEYMPNKSLDYFLFDSARVMLLDWNKRFSIIEGIAQGLLYLHKYSRVRVIHRDLKASNILLDENMIPKISDFGMARIFSHNEPQANTNRVVGTYGYMSPEYAMQGTFSIKSDVYSFGVMMLEIISGRKNNSFHNDDRVLNIVGYAWELWKDGRGLELMDPTLSDSCIEDQFLRCIHVGLLCVEENAVDRPTISDIISMLTNESIYLPVPTKPAFYTERKVVRAGIDGNGSEIISVNGMSNSEFEAR
ncbi:G-type lectin S-receptor-like serine/threonine-protein kinase At1g67520 isoform X1 [Rosa rugosa]|uniref:G-type lectin S-receptor-like serine/threonine-protein kinase At1g67520 isoform X1 n=2 Tax=Rosa rugosa TaxID=74645 RepID=UPI002B415C65|nr:G-type lectin S-receptor-like serine/threonine-protein kinase At1g67520 isoform X1 [Rosa rugosa]